MRDKALWVGLLMYRIMFTLGHSCVCKSHQLFSCEFAKLAGMVLRGRISWCSWRSCCIFPAIIWEMQTVSKGVSFYPIYDWWINCPSDDVELWWDSKASCQSQMILLSEALAPLRLQICITSLHENESFILELEVPLGVASSCHHDLTTWVHSRFNLKRFTATTQWQLISITQPKLNDS